jgi:Transposase and inactivated derivatives, IS30 family
MSYHHISICERAKIEELNKLGFSTHQIGARIGRHHSSVARELLRLGEEKYNAELSQANYESKRKNSKPRGKWNEELCATVAEKLKATWSPEQISHTVTLDKLSFKTIYNWLYAGRLNDLTVDVLRRKGKKKTSQTAIFYARGTPIRKRPKEVYGRKTFGHWELDTVVSSRAASGCFATFVERKTRFYTAIPLSDRTADSMESAIKCLYHFFPEGTFKTATTDRGGEFSCFDTVQKDLGLTLYFADPYCPHQRGSNEYSNGLLREFYPKGADLGTVSNTDLANSLFLINSRPRKCLGWISPIQLFLHELSHLT